MIKMYSTDCSKCKALEMKLKKENIEFEVTHDLTPIEGKAQSAPVLELENGELLQFNDAVRWASSH